MSKLVRVMIHDRTFEILNDLTKLDVNLSTRLSLSAHLANVLQSKTQPEQYQVLVDKILAEFETS